MSEIKLGNGKCTFNPDTLEAYSYDWWLFTKVIKGKLLFNNYSYSSATTRHQFEVRHLLKEMGLEIYLEVEVSRGLQSEGFNKILDNFYLKMFTLEAEVKNPSIKNKESRIFDINEIKENIKKARGLGFKNTLKIKELKAKAEEDYANHLEREKRKREERKAAARKKLPASTQLLLKIKDSFGAELC